VIFLRAFGNAAFYLFVQLELVMDRASPIGGKRKQSFLQSLLEEVEIRRVYCNLKKPNKI
jgi:hypothetical protein